MGAMTIKVYHVTSDGVRGPVRAQVAVGTREGPPMPVEPMWSSAYPPCSCSRCKELAGSLECG